MELRRSIWRKRTTSRHRALIVTLDFQAPCPVQHLPRDIITYVPAPIVARLATRATHRQQGVLAISVLRTANEYAGSIESRKEIIDRDRDEIAFVVQYDPAAY